jgi:hypothetical protein
MQRKKLFVLLFITCIPINPIYIAFTILFSGGSGSKKKRSSTSASDASTPVSDASTPVSDASPLEERIDSLSIHDDDKKVSGDADLTKRMESKYGLDDFNSIVSTVVQNEG